MFIYATVDVADIRRKSGRNLHTYTVLQTEVYVLRIRIRCAAFCRRKYVEVLKKEIESRLDKWVSVDTVYVGGGTPSMLERGMLKEIFDSLSKACDMRAKEITVECNPDSVDKEFCDEIISAGVNRVSIGLQTANDKLLKCVNRPHDLSSFYVHGNRFRP